MTRRMTNDEIRMTKEFSNDEVRKGMAAVRSAFRASGFVILSSFVLRHSSLLLLWCLTSGAAELKLPPHSRVTLPNGVVLLLMEQHEVPLVSFNVLLSLGST